jgi:Xaa-Pro dipeptidase
MESEHVNREVAKRYMAVGGIRIEDVVVITGDGHENLTLVKSELEFVEGCHGDDI